MTAKGLPDRGHAGAPAGYAAMSVLGLLISTYFWAVGPLFGSALSPAPVKVAFIGDQGLREDSKAVLRLIKSEGAHMVMHQGDFDYMDNPDRWDRQISDILGADYPYFSSLGNHDVKARQGYVRKQEERLAKVSGVVCSGRTMMQQTCVYRGLFMVFVAAGLGPDPGYAAYIRERLAADNSLWRLCSWHIPQPEMQVGGKTDKVGWEVYEECRRGGALIATGHEHSYSRTFLMKEFKTQSVASQEGVLKLEKGRSFAFVSGLGGESVRDQERGGHWWASIFTKTQNADSGALFCTFFSPSPERASCYFKDIAGKVPDRFELESGLNAGRWWRQR